MPKDTCKSTKSIALLFDDDDDSVITLCCSSLRSFLFGDLCVYMCARVLLRDPRFNFEEFSPQSRAFGEKKNSQKAVKSHDMREKKNEAFAV